MNPKPWHWDGHANEWTVYNSADWPVCNLVNDDGSLARLIATAPEMLWTLRQIVKQSRNTYVGKLAYNVLVKADGLE